ncbi:MAG TPA: penicillin-binding protein 2 [Spirochaetia bacterium]|nr:penicillin-binding protein 2 [Spirochaetia bacterium]
MSSSVNLKPRQTTGFGKRLSLFLYISYFIFFIILIRFFDLQIRKAEHYLLLSEGNTEQRYPLIPPRGLIYDRNGVLLAKNKPSYHLNIIPAYLPKNKKDREKTLKLVSEKFDIPYNFLLNKISGNLRSYRSILIKESIPKSKLLFLEEHRQDFSFLNAIEYSARIYSLAEASSHLLGYIGIISLSEIEQYKDKNYRGDSIIGKNGIEKQYDYLLRGVEGETVKIVNSLGKPIRNLNEKGIPSVTGKNLVLSIDSRIQDSAYALLDGRKGIIIVTKPATGEVIAFVSSPGFDANLFIHPDTRQEVFSKLLNSEEKPFLNRIIQGRYPTGSIFKIVTAMAALEDEKINPYEKVFCKGYFELGNRVFKDLKQHGLIDLFEAIEKSSNTFFYTLGYKLGYAALLEYSNHLGLNSMTGIDIPGEIASFIPTPEWKESRFKEQWYDGDTVNASIGQGFINLTPLGAHNIISSVAAGKIYKYRLLWKVKNPYTQITEENYQPELFNSFVLKQKTLTVLREALKRVPVSGTAVYHKYLSEVQIAGKTGSAQNVYSKKTHSWFVSYGPIDKPLEEQYAVTVMVESSGHGGSFAVPISSMIYNLLENKINKEQALKRINEIFRYQDEKYENSVQD